MELLVLIGPTGVGKTAYALEMAQRYQCPILNADSRQIYREIPIGTAAPTTEEQQLVTHYFVGTKSITEEYNAGQYERDCMEVIHELIRQRSTLSCSDSTPFAILTGGSMMYIDAICRGLDDIPTIPTDIREQVKTLYKTQGLQGLQEKVQHLDPAYWQIVDPANPQRLMHAIEVCMVTGGTFTALRKRKQALRPFTVRKIGLRRNREALYDRINQRVKEMIRQGLVEEAQRAFAQTGVLQGKPLPNSLNTVGYKELYQYIQGELSFDQAVEMIQQNSRHYAKRQMTWWNRDSDIQWIDLIV